jgi:hypothetical protein
MGARNVLSVLTFFMASRVHRVEKFEMLSDASSKSGLLHTVSCLLLNLLYCLEQKKLVVKIMTQWKMLQCKRVVVV